MRRRTSRSLSEQLNTHWTSTASRPRKLHISRLWLLINLTHSVDFERLAAGPALYIRSGLILCFILRFTYIQLRFSHWIDAAYTTSACALYQFTFPVSYFFGRCLIYFVVFRDVVLGLGPWLSLRTKPESLVLVLRFMSLNKSLIVVFVFPKVNDHCASARCFLQRVSIACYAKRCTILAIVNPSVRPSHAGTVSKRLQLRSWGLHCRIAPWL